MPRPPSDAVQVAIRISPKLLTEADEVAKLMSKPGFEATRTDALRVAIARGLAAIRREEESRPKTADAAVIAALEKFAQRDKAPCSLDVIELVAREAGFDTMDVDDAMRRLLEAARITRTGNGYKLTTSKTKSKS